MHIFTKHFGRYFAGLALVAAVALPLSASALTPDKMQTQIAILLQKVSVLRDQMAAMSQSQPPQTTATRPTYPVSSSCTFLNRNLSLGVRGDDVRGLQEFLILNGHLSAQPTGYFGVMTRAAVRAWQSSEGISSVGSVGPMTRERMQQGCGSDSEQLRAFPRTGSAPLTVTFATNISGFRVPSVTYLLDFGDGIQEKPNDCLAPADACMEPGKNTHTYMRGGSYTVTLSKVTNICAGMELTCKAAIQTEVEAKTVVLVNSGPTMCTAQYSPVCGAKPIYCITTPCNPVPTTYGNSCSMSADNATFLYDGACKDDTYNPANDAQCKQWSDGCNTCSRSSPGGMAACTLMYCPNPQKPYCKANFDTNNKPPTISSLSGPTVLALNTAGTWTVSANDPENGQLSYQIWWGDENAYATANTGSAMVAREFVQTTTFSHAYVSAGTYTVTIVVRDNAGQEAKTSTTVKVGSDMVICTAQYDPVCGQPAEPACRRSIPACMMPTPGPQTYSNSCALSAAGATFLYAGQCKSTY